MVTLNILSVIIIAYPTLYAQHIPIDILGGYRLDPSLLQQKPSPVLNTINKNYGQSQVPNRIYNNYLQQQRNQKSTRFPQKQRFDDLRFQEFQDQNNAYQLPERQQVSNFLDDKSQNIEQARGVGLYGEPENIEQRPRGTGPLYEQPQNLGQQFSRMGQIYEGPQNFGQQARRIGQLYEGPQSIRQQARRTGQLYGQLQNINEKGLPMRQPYGEPQNIQQEDRFMGKPYQKERNRNIPVIYQNYFLEGKQNNQYQKTPSRVLTRQMKLGTSNINPFLSPQKWLNQYIQTPSSQIQSPIANQIIGRERQKPFLQQLFNKYSQQPQGVPTRRDQQLMLQQTRAKQYPQPSQRILTGQSLNKIPTQPDQRLFLQQSPFNQYVQPRRNVFQRNPIKNIPTGVNARIQPQKSPFSKYFQEPKGIYPGQAKDKLYAATGFPIRQYTGKFEFPSQVRPLYPRQSQNVLYQPELISGNVDARTLNPKRDKSYPKSASSKGSLSQKRPVQHKIPYGQPYYGVQQEPVSKLQTSSKMGKSQQLAKSESAQKGSEKTCLNHPKSRFLQTASKELPIRIVIMKNRHDLTCPCRNRTTALRYNKDNFPRKTQISMLDVKPEMSKNVTQALIASLLFKGTYRGKKCHDVEAEDITNCSCGLTLKRRIVGGEETKEGDHPWMVGLYVVTDFSSPFCAGTLITDKWIVSAAHCFLFVHDPTVMLAKVGNYNVRKKDKNEIDAPVELYIQHPGFHVDMGINDIALVKVKERIPLNMYRTPICLPIAYQKCSWVDDSIRVIGWGKLREAGRLPKALMGADVTVTSTKKCYEKFSQVTGKNLCGYEPGKDTCQGDSGGPAVWSHKGRYYIVGIVSWGLGCGRLNSPGIYTKVSAFVPWILRTTGESFCQPKMKEDKKDKKKDSKVK